MTWARIVGAAFTSLVVIISWFVGINDTYGKLPERVAAVEQQQRQDTTKINEMDKTLSHMAGQLDIIVDYVKRGRK